MAVFLVAFLAWVVATEMLFVHPSTSLPKRADAIVVLSGDHGERLPKALDLIRSGLSSRLVLVGEPDSVQNLELCRGDQPFEVICLRPNPDNTRAEAQATGRLIAERKWQNAVVVTSTQHVSRAGMVFDRCTNARIHMVAAEPPFDRLEMAVQVAREWAKWGYTSFLTRGC